MGWSKSNQDKIQITLNEPREESYDSSQLCAFPVQSTKQRRCKVCAAEATGRERDNMRRIFSQCQRCGKDVTKLYANGITSDSAASVSNWWVLRFMFCGVLILQCFLRSFSIMCPSKELYVFFKLTQHIVRS